MKLNDRVLVISGQHAGRTGTVTAIDEVFGIGVHLGHVDPHCCHPFNAEELTVIEGGDQ